MLHNNHFRALFIAMVLASLIVLAPAAHAYEWERPLSTGDSGKDVKALQIRLAGWFPSDKPERFFLDGAYGAQTEAALKRFQEHYGLPADGSAGKRVFNKLEELTDKDGSTKHFDWSEFTQNRNPACSAKANAHAGTFGGGMVAPVVVKRNVKLLMWRLEAIRAKGGGQPVGINSGFRSIAYNDCIGGARESQHLYGTAADNRMAETHNHRERTLAKRSQISGIGCYSDLSHNHFDVRVENQKNEDAAFWWWPDRDKKGRDLDAGGSPCFGERRRARIAFARITPPVTTPSVLTAIVRLIPGAGSRLPNATEIATFSTSGEVLDLGGRD
jgi:zinc D-Ala-D-Ala carboxypeptidase